MADYEKEMLELHNYSTSLKSIVDNINTSSFPMRKTRTGMIPVIPKSQIPDIDILNNDTILKNTMRIVSKKVASLEVRKNKEG